MSKDNFEIELGRKLRNMEAPVNPAIWSAIASRINAPLPPVSGGMGFATGIAAGVILLAGLSMYSNFKTKDLPIALQSETIASSEVSNTVPEIKFNDTVAETLTSPSQAPVVPNSESNVQSQFVLGTHSAYDEQEVEQNPSADIFESVVQSIPAKEAITNLDKQEVANAEETLIIPRTTSTTAADLPRLSANIKANTLSGYTPLIVNFDNLGSAEYHHWDFGIKGKSDSKEATVLYDEPGIYTVYLNVEDKDGNTRTDMVTINVKEGSNLVAPDSFTPNGDGLNDTYKVEGLHIADFHLTIVNSKGKPVFETHNINSGWVFEPNVHGGNGEFYIAVVKAKGVDGKDYSFFKKLNIIY